MGVVLWAVAGVLFALLPLAHWLLRARHGVLRAAVAGGLLLWLALVAAVAFDLLRPRSKAEIYLLCVPVAELAVLLGVWLDRRMAGPLTVRPSGWRRAAGIAFHAQLGLVLPLTPLLALVAFHEAQLPSPRAVPEPPPGYTVLDDGEDCGNGHGATCWRTLYLAGPPGVPTEAAADRLRPRQRCEANGWLLDRRDLCTDVSTDGATIVYRVLLGGSD
ncbi:hypothetical protein [Kitasatospora cheerisanensis]|uniref:Uncharacterized protein n=1 Tax=Kitasatospora cheerisanensis KCTC 2395 TaxID=1348663 RepID=A0A066ZD22_9ACTN|nr:hypothetical protein [Kitasatospora cheerisanensis]KDN88206.1 hypothetical protein KCH_00560 [Kitasatospora cheerisanensis KCTC 2395]